QARTARPVSHRGGGVTVTATGQLIAPHGGELVDRTGPRPDDVEQLEVVTLPSRELSDLDLLASGALSPLEGFMNREDYERVVEEMRLPRRRPQGAPPSPAAPCSRRR